MMKLPTFLHYTAEHIWVQKTDDGNWLAGITDYAQDLLGDIVYLQLPKVGDSLVAGQACGLVESVKTGSDLHAPMDGVVTEINETLVNLPETINDDAYQAWLFKFTPTNTSNTQDLLTAEAYAQRLD